LRARAEVYEPPTIARWLRSTAHYAVSVRLCQHHCDDTDVPRQQCDHSEPLLSGGAC